MKDSLKVSAVVLLAIVALVAAIVISGFFGYALRWFIWFICGAYELFFGRGMITRWIYNHDTAVHIICSIFVFVIILAEVTSKKK